MPFSHHSHSGQFCAHATSTLEEMLLTAIHHKMSTYALTEHMPRGARDLYPEEIAQTIQKTPGGRDLPLDEIKERAAKGLADLFDGYFKEAVRLREKYVGKIEVLIGMEVDWIRAESSGEWIEGLLGRYEMDFLVGSVHHVHSVPIDYDKGMYVEAREKCGGGGNTEEGIFAAYFDAQFEMLRALRPVVVGHFDLVRLLSEVPDGGLRGIGGGVVWERVLRNLEFIGGYGGVVEINSAALRKGLGEPYPGGEICREIIARGIPVTLSDDAHGVDQVGTNYGKALEFAEDVGFQSFVYLERCTAGTKNRFPTTTMKQVSLAELKQHPYFS